MICPVKVQIREGKDNGMLSIAKLVESKPAVKPPERSRDGKSPLHCASDVPGAIRVMM